MRMDIVARKMRGPLTAILLSTALLLSCDKAPEEISLSFKLPEADASAGEQFVAVEASGEWTMTILTDGDDSVEWAWLGTYSGDEQSVTLSGCGPLNTVVFNWAANLSCEKRSCTLHLASGESQATVLFTQDGAEQQQKTASQITSDKVYGWLELPAAEEGDKLYFITHWMKDGSQRNYSYCWDTEALVAHWVAYPLNSGLIGHGSRTNQWGPDPKVPSALQPELYSGYRGGFQRGHQIPSADRLDYSSNISTFYFTNLTPQRGELNEMAWMGLEGMVRNWSYSVDTLYVVTGCVTKGSNEYAYDNAGKRVTVPTGYYKALLGYKKGATVGASTKGYISIGFYFDHKGYANDRSIIMDHAMSIDALEERVGVDFFVNLPSLIGQEMADRVEAVPDSFWNR